MNTLTNLEAYTQYLIAQAVMSHDDSLDYVEARYCIHCYMTFESEEFWYREPQSNPHNWPIAW